MARFVKVGRLENFREGHGRAVKVDGVNVAVFKLDGRLYALRDACPHMGLSLAEGKLAGASVTCHGHGWTFELASGRSDRRTGACAKVHEVRIDGADVFVRSWDPTPSASRPDDDWVPWDDKFLK